jgi:ElaB/YqjD/DUF883 family membrane-anchored ribosome-binding protein
MENNTTETTTTTAEQVEKVEVFDLQSILQQTTEEKKPGAAKVAPAASNFWEASDDDFEPVKKETAAPKPEATKAGAAAETETTEATKPKLTDSVIKSSARTATGMIELTTKMIITPIQNYKFKKKLEKSFTDAQLNKIDEKLMDADAKSLDDEEKRLKARFERMMDKQQKKLDGIEFNPDEKKDLTEAFEEYMKFTQSTLSPAWFVGLAIINTVGRRAVDTFTD